MSSALPSDPLRRAPSLPRLSLFRRVLQRPEWGLMFATVVVIVLTTVLDRDHNYVIDPAASAKDILRQVSLLGMFALGAAIVIIAGGIDLSCGSVIAFSGSMFATLLVLLSPETFEKSEALGWTNILLALTGTLIIGFLIGTFHAWLITVVKLPPFIATLSTLVGLRSLARIIVKGAVGSTQIDISDAQFELLAGDIRIPALVFAALAFLTWLLMSRTVTGRHLIALGGNEQAARLSGVQTDRLKWLAYCLSAILSSIAGIFYVSQTTSAAPETLARGYELNAIAAAVVGGCSLQGGVGTIPGAVLGVVFLRVVLDGVSKVIKQQAETYEGLLVGIVVVIAVAFTQLRQGGWLRQRFFSAPVGLVTLAGGALLACGLVLVFVPMDVHLRAIIVRSALLFLSALTVLVAAGWLIRCLQRRPKVIAKK